MSLKHKIKKSSILVLLIGCCFFAYNSYWQDKAYKHLLPNSATALLRFSTTTLAKELAFSVLKNPKTYYQKYRDTSGINPVTKPSFFKAFGLPASVFAFIDKADTTALYIPLKIKNKQQALYFIKTYLGPFKISKKDQYTLATNTSRWSFAYDTKKILLRYAYIKKDTHEVFKHFFTTTTFLDRKTALLQGVAKKNTLVQAYTSTGSYAMLKSNKNKLIITGNFTSTSALPKQKNYSVACLPQAHTAITAHFIPQGLSKENNQKLAPFLGTIAQQLIQKSSFFALQGCTEVLQKKISYTYDADFNKIPKTVVGTDSIAAMVLITKDTTTLLKSRYTNYYTWYAKKITPAYTQYTTDSTFVNKRLKTRKTPYFLELQIHPRKLPCLVDIPFLQHASFSCLQCSLENTSQYIKLKANITQKQTNIHPLLCFF